MITHVSPLYSDLNFVRSGIHDSVKIYLPQDSNPGNNVTLKFP